MIFSLALLFADVGAEVDWSHDWESLDQELHKLQPEGRAGRRLADKLVKARSRSGHRSSPTRSSNA